MGLLGRAMALNNDVAQFSRAMEETIARQPAGKAFRYLNSGSTYIEGTPFKKDDGIRRLLLPFGYDYLTTGFLEMQSRSSGCGAYSAPLSENRTSIPPDTVSTESDLSVSALLLCRLLFPETEWTWTP